MCEDNDYGQLLEEYRGMMESLFSNLITRIVHAENEVFKFKYKEELRREREEIDRMTMAMEGSE